MTHKTQSCPEFVDEETQGQGGDLAMAMAARLLSARVWLRILPPEEKTACP